jgi:CRP/FNR family transcriptional regulator, nitrogen fixation regulation protein
MKNVIKLSATSSQNNGMAYYRHLLANRPHPLKNLDALATITSFHRGQKICSRDQTAEHQTLEHWYFLISGAVRRCAIRSDGHRQIVDLLLPGDFFGLAFGDQTDAIIEAAAQNTVVASYPRSRIELLADSDPKIARELREITFKALSRIQGQVMILGRITAIEKVGSFILEMAGRLSDGKSDGVSLPVSRYDIADYLGVSVETVSRAISELQHRGAIKLLNTRTVSIIYRRVLEERVRPEGTRQLVNHAQRVAA